MKFLKTGCGWIQASCFSIGFNFNSLEILLIFQLERYFGTEKKEIRKPLQREWENTGTLFIIIIYIYMSYLLCMVICCKGDTAAKMK
jgi:hypothetical protein